MVSAMTYSPEELQTLDTYGSSIPHSGLFITRDDVIKATQARLASQVHTPSASKNIENMSEREFSQYMTKYAHDLGVQADSNKIQRAVADALKAGLNPRMLISSLSPSGVSASSAYSYGQSDSETKSSSFSSSAVLAGLIMALAKLLL